MGRVQWESRTEAASHLAVSEKASKSNLILAEGQGWEGISQEYHLREQPLNHPWGSVTAASATPTPLSPDTVQVPPRPPHPSDALEISAAEETVGVVDTFIILTVIMPSYTVVKAYQLIRAPLVAQRVKNPPAVQETGVRSLGRKDPLEKGKATYSGILAWRIPWTEEPGGLQSMESQTLEHNWVTNTHISLYLGLFWWFSGKESTYSAGDTEEKGSIPGLGRSLEKGMATHSSILAWRIPWTEEPGGLQFIGLHEVRQYRSNLAHSINLYTCSSLYVSYTSIKFKNSNEWNQMKCLFKNKSLSGLPRWSSGWDSVLPMQGARVQSLLKELDPTCCN